MTPFTHDLESLALTPVTQLLFAQIVREETNESLQRDLSEVMSRVSRPYPPDELPVGFSCIRHLWRDQLEYREGVAGMGDDSISGD